MPVMLQTRVQVRDVVSTVCTKCRRLQQTKGKDTHAPVRLEYGSTNDVGQKIAEDVLRHGAVGSRKSYGSGHAVMLFVESLIHPWSMEKAMAARKRRG